MRVSGLIGFVWSELW